MLGQTIRKMIAGLSAAGLLAMAGTTAQAQMLNPGGVTRSDLAEAITASGGTIINAVDDNALIVNSKFGDRYIALVKGCDERGCPYVVFFAVYPNPRTTSTATVNRYNDKRADGTFAAVTEKGSIISEYSPIVVGGITKGALRAHAVFYTYGTKDVRENLVVGTLASYGEGDRTPDKGMSTVEISLRDDDLTKSLNTMTPTTFAKLTAAEFDVMKALEARIDTQMETSPVTEEMLNALID